MIVARRSRRSRSFVLRDLRTLRMRSADPVIPAEALAKYDSKVEERRHRRYGRLCAVVDGSIV